MNNIVNIGFWLVPLLIDLLAISYYWQLKEYRLDRMRDFLQYDEGKKIIFSPHNLIITGLLLVSIGISRSFISGPSEFILLAGSLAIILLKTLVILKKGVMRPKPTIKMLGIIALTITIQAGIFMLFYTKVTLPILLLIQPFIITALVLLLILPTKAVKFFFINRATKKINQSSNLISIGITGSYGKSSTKEFLAQLLEQKHTILKTPRNINTEIGVARLILNKLTNTHSHFVVEMGAYKKGEIKVLTKMVQPRIGIITAIAEQHLSLFGSIENIRDTKAELPLNIQPDGVTILNADNDHSLQIGSQIPNNDKTHYFSIQPNSEVACKLISSIKKENNTWELTIELFQEQITLQIPLPAPHFAQNLLPALIAAKLLGLTNEEIIQFAPQITLPDSTFKVYQTSTNITVIDDSYNANPIGFKTAIELLIKQPIQGKKYIVTMGMLELGQMSAQKHREIAKLIINSNIHCFVTKQTSFKHFSHAAIELNKDPLDNFTHIDNLKMVATTIKDALKPGDAILLENRVPTELKNSLNPEA